MATTNILLTTFPGLDLPRTLSLPLQSTTSTSTLCSRIADLLPPSIDPQNLLLTTSTSHRILASSAPLSSLLLLTTQNDQHKPTPILPLTLRPRTLGGKGGFGSQLRAAGGRMSSKSKNRQRAANSNRNLDGRRLRTIEEAKRLTEYLAVKPGMEKREKEERYRRWTQIVEDIERREEEMREGKGRRVEGQWYEEKGELEETVRGEVARGLGVGLGKEGDGEKCGGEDEGSSAESGEGSHASESESAEGEINEGDPVKESGSKNEKTTDVKGKGKKVWGWDEEDEDDDMSEEEEEGTLI